MERGGGGQPPILPGSVRTFIVPAKRIQSGLRQSQIDRGGREQAYFVGDRQRGFETQIVGGCRDIGSHIALPRLGGAAQIDVEPLAQQSLQRSAAADQAVDERHRRIGDFDRAIQPGARHRNAPRAVEQILNGALTVQTAGLSAFVGHRAGETKGNRLVQSAAAKGEPKIVDARFLTSFRLRQSETRRFDAHSQRSLCRIERLGRSAAKRPLQILDGSHDPQRRREVPGMRRIGRQRAQSLGRQIPFDLARPRQPRRAVQRQRQIGLQPLRVQRAENFGALRSCRRGDLNA
ncbi:MAG: hypothetical protein BWZ10_03080 [candidate division BRC1 bacterium ADurb.BinA364]|nr:MAG: hypothetical protein BWZ10_03080 [candidate division BRC1 bacterium ADurb.BinA364]